MKKVFFYFLFAFSLYAQDYNFTVEGGGSASFTVENRGGVNYLHFNGYTSQGPYTFINFPSLLDGNFHAVQSSNLPNNGTGWLVQWCDGVGNVLGSANFGGGSAPSVQTCTISATGLTVPEGQNMTGYASGSLGGNYSAEIVSGQGGISINSITGVYVVTPSSVGELKFRVKILASGSIPESEPVLGFMNVVGSKKVNINLPANKTKYSVTYVLKQGGVELGRYTQAAGANSKAVSIKVPSDGEVTMEKMTSGICLDGITFIEDANGVFIDPLVEKFTPSTSDVVKDVIPSKFKDPAQSAQNANVWSAESPSTPLTVNVFREGIDRLINVQNPTSAVAFEGLTNSQYQNGVSSLLTGLSNQENASLQNTNALTNSLNDLRLDVKNASGSADLNADKSNGFLSDILDKLSDPYNVSTSSGQTKAQSDSLNSVKGDISSNASQAAVSSASSFANQGKEASMNAISQFSRPATDQIASEITPLNSDDSIDINLGGGKTIKFVMNPFSSAGPFGGVIGLCAAFIRHLIAWSIVAGFFTFILKEVRSMIANTFFTPAFSDSIVTSVNSVKIFGFGGGVGYATKIVLFALIGTIVLTMPVIVIASVTSALPFSELQLVFTTMPTLASSGASGSPILAKALSLANCLIPWVLLISTPVYYFILQTVLFPSQFFWLMFFKFLPT